MTAAAVGIVALASYNLGIKILIDRFSIIVATFAGSLSMIYRHFPWLYPLLMIGGALSEYIYGLVLPQSPINVQSSEETETLLNSTQPKPVQFSIPKSTGIMSFVSLFYFQSSFFYKSIATGF